MKKKLNLLVSGYNGYIGKELIKFFKKKKISFSTFDYEKKNLILTEFSHFIHLDFKIKENKRNYEINLKNTKKIINLCLTNRIFLIFPSTAAFRYSNKKRISKDLFAFNNYILAKKKLEKEIIEARKFGLKYTIFRIFNVYGGTLNNRYLISNIIKNFKNKKRVFVKYKKNFRDYIHVYDLCKLFYKSLIKNKIGIFEVGSGKAISIEKIALIIKKKFQKREIIFSKPLKSKNNYSISKINNTKKKFNWAPKIKLENGIEDLINKKSNS